MLLKEKCGSENQGLGIGSRLGDSRSGLPWRFDAGRQPDHESGGAASRPHGATAGHGPIEGKQDGSCAAERHSDPERPCLGEQRVTSSGGGSSVQVQFELVGDDDYQRSTIRQARCLARHGFLSRSDLASIIDVKTTRPDE